MEHIIYTSDIFEYVETNKQEIIENLNDNEIEVNEDTIYNEAQNLCDFDYECLLDQIKCFDKKHGHKILALATLGLWYGKVKGGKIFEDLESALSSAYEDTNTLFYKNKNATLELEARHHDGTNHFKFYELTDEGENWLLNNEDRYDRQTLHEKLLSNKYVRAITYSGLVSCY